MTTKQLEQFVREKLDIGKHHSLRSLDSVGCILQALDDARKPWTLMHPDEIPRYYKGVYGIGKYRVSVHGRWTSPATRTWGSAADDSLPIALLKAIVASYGADPGANPSDERLGEHEMRTVVVAPSCGYYQCSCGWRSSVSCDGDQDPNKSLEERRRHLLEVGEE